VLDRILWIVVGVLAAVLLASVAWGYQDGFPLNRIGLVIGTALGSLTALGLLCRGGPIVPCMILGMVVFSSLTSPFAHSHQEAVFKDLGVPLIGAICGALFGFMLDFQRSRTSKPNHNDANGNQTR
jgi:hypothetical protein